MSKFYFLILTLLFFWSCSLRAVAQESWSPQHVFYGKGGVLTYTPDDQGNIIPDFSHVGYQYGDVPIPDIETVVEVSPVDGDDGATIQAAINSLYTKEPDENGFRGAVLLKAGTYHVAGQITITASGIVLRGEGDTDDGTVIIAEGTSQRELIKVDNGSARTVHSATKVNIKEEYVPVGRKFVVVSDASGFSEGDQIVLYRPGTSQWISDLKMNQIPPRSDGGTVTQWSPSGYSFYFERLITRVSGDTLFFRNPVVMAMETKYGGGSVFKFSFNRLQNIGVENICFKSVYASEEDEQHSQTAVYFISVEHGWVRNVTSWYFSFSCVNLHSKARLITVENCHSREPKSLITGSRRYSFNVNGSLCLIKNCSTTEGRHDFVTGSRIPGPNVFSRCTSSNTHADIGPHQRWAMGTLYEIIESDGEINVQDRDNMGSGHGWAGANHVFWNCKSKAAICQNPWVSAKNFNFGFIGSKNNGSRSGRPDGEWVGHNVPGIFPVSLYEAQLDERLNGTTVFSVVPALTSVNDTAYVMHFSLPVNQQSINVSNFEVSGTIDFQNDALTVVLNDEYSVMISSPEFKKLSDLSTIIVKCKEMSSEDGKSLLGNTSSSYTIPDRRPYVTGLPKIADNVNGFAEASATKPGTLYLVKYGVKAETVEELDSLVNLNLGRKTKVDEVDVMVPISTKGLPGGYYEYYAADDDRRVSTPSVSWVIVEQKGPVTGVEPGISLNQFIAYRNNLQVIIEPAHDKVYSLEIYTYAGQLIFRGLNLRGDQRLDINNNHGILIIRKRAGNEVSVVKLK